MNKLNYILKSFLHFKRQHLAVMLGVILSTAVLTGALIVGDSVKFSLGKIVENRLGKIEFVVLTNERFVRAEIGIEISEKLNVKSASLLILEGVAVNPTNESRINKTQVVGVDRNFGQLFEKTMPELKEDEAIISSNVAERLKLKVNDELILRVEKLSVIPVNSPYSAENDAANISFRLKIIAIADAQSFGSFSLKNSQLSPINIFVSRKFLANKLDVDGLANAIVFSQNPESKLTTEILDSTFQEVWTLKDAGLQVKRLDEKGNYELVSDRIFIDKQISNSILTKDFPAQKILSYLVNEIKLGEKTTPYSFVSAVSNDFYGKEIRANEIIINQWLADDLNAKSGDSLHLKYFVIDEHQNLQQDSSIFVVKEIIPTKNEQINRSLMPAFPGFTQAISCMDWSTNAPIDMKKIRDKDEKYWLEFRGTPKAVIGIENGKRIWNNRFGEFTSIRFKDTVANTDLLNAQILKKIKPSDLNFSAVDVKNKGQYAAQTGVDFGQLFLSLSFFILLAGIILTIMLYVLSLEARKSEIGLLIGLGYTKNQIIRLRLMENILPIFIASILGVLAGIAYNFVLLKAINSVWIDIVRTSMMDIHIKPSTLIIGALSGFVISFVSIYFVVRKFVHKTAISLINNNSTSTPLFRNRKNEVANLMAFLSLTSSVGLLMYSLNFSTEVPALFLLSGTLFMVGSVFLTRSLWIQKQKKSSELLTFSALSVKNLSRNSSRSLVIVVLLALGVFVVMISGANKKTYRGGENSRQSGTGAYDLWVESSVPIYEKLNRSEGRQKLGFEDDRLFEKVNFVQMLTMNGDDASCINLNHIEKPRIVGVDAQEFAARKSFSLEQVAENVDASEGWKLLEKEYGGNVIPAFADQTVIVWGLLKKIGDTLSYTNERGEALKLVLVSGLSSSVFQGNILISEKHFRENFPSVSGSKLMLVEAGANTDTINKLLISTLQDYGIETQSTKDRLKQFYSVTNTYLSVFMLLGALGILIATFGIGILLFRNMLDRRQEIAMMLALGFTKRQIFKLIFRENLVLVLLGMGIGLTSALIGILPSLISVQFELPATFITLLVAFIFANAVVWVWVPIKMQIKANLVGVLKNE